ncbi:apolipoprotein N-acyltransferase [Leucobacter sp. Psy1]|uniref:apolipoprotein N-acyltransferase n=1 Tax=Leucobacter sp. Psy1 TaxID=2875729 RepID=UPI001CD4B120|nr:apolipoprotein N-acyltransferase [Leucobacter sp. Psy1]UBH06148.1 apolipoprotein N-acyltransferase [Leucobacter sp. Psy1]
MGVDRRLPWWAALGSAALGGFLLDVATPGLAWWPVAFIAVPLVLAALWQQRSSFGALLGAVAGAAFWLPHISWLTLYLGPVPWLALGTVMILWFALFGCCAALATRFLARVLRARALRARWIALTQACTVAGLWVTREQLQSSWPYGGFAWGRLAQTQAESPLAQSVSWTGTAGLSGLLVLLCAVPVAVAFAAGAPSWRSFASPRAIRSGLVPAGGVSLVGLVLLGLVPPAPLLGAPDGADERTLTVAAVQGNAKAGIFDDRESGDVLRAHLDTTRRMLDELDERGDSVDVIVWPENSGEFDLPGHVLNSARVAQLSSRADAPIVAGSVLRDRSARSADDGSGSAPEETYTNSAVVWDAEGDTGVRYDKRRPVPFAEYMPNRPFFHALAPELVDLVQLEYQAGELPASVDIDTPAGVVRAGMAICFDIIFDEHARAMQSTGAEIIFAPTNNADFGRTDESAQQLQIARLRAIEMGRGLVNVSTVGTSAIVAPDGRDLDRLTPYTADWMVADVPLRSGTTPAMLFGVGVASMWVALGVAPLKLALASGVARKFRGGGSTSTSRRAGTSGA